ncbi:MAG: hypothetical protein CL916_00065, partial [Deltaproteobacteria bacterium]|nr:hypothetical protein [Deltaproteobacteria bacterium]
MILPLVQMVQKGIFFLVAALVFLYSAKVHASTLHSDFYGYFSTLLILSEIVCGFSLLGFLSYNFFVDLENIKAAKNLKPNNAKKESSPKTDVAQIIEKAIRWLISLAIPLCLVLIPILGISIHDSESGISFFDYIFFENRELWASFGTQRFFSSPFSMMIGVSLGLLIPTLSVALNAVFFRIGLSFLRERVLDGKTQENDIWFIRIFRVGMSFFESLPFFIPLIGVRLYFTNSVNIQATLDTYSDSVDLFRPFYATTGFHIGIFFTALFLGLQLGASLSNWIHKEEEISHSSIYGRLSFLGNRRLSLQVIRERLWLESREKFIEKILIGLSVLFLTETICGLVIDSFVLTGSTKSIQIAPLYPSLGSILFIKKFQEGMGDISAAHLSILLALLIIPMIIASIPKVVRLSYIKEDTLYIPTGKPWTQGAKKDEIWTPHTLGINFVLGESGTGKSTYLVALRNSEPGNSIPVPQDPDF